MLALLRWQWSVLGKAMTAPEPGQRAFNDPAFALGLKGAERFQQWHCTVIVLNIDGMDLNCNDVSLAPFQSLCRIKSTRSAILTVDVTCIVQAITPILFARDFGPRHVVLPR